MCWDFQVAEETPESDWTTQDMTAVARFRARTGIHVARTVFRQLTQPGPRRIIARPEGFIVEWDDDADRDVGMRTLDAAMQTAIFRPGRERTSWAGIRTPSGRSRYFRRSQDNTLASAPSTPNEMGDHYELADGSQWLGDVPLAD